MDTSTFILYLLGIKVDTFLFLKVMNMHAGSLVARIFACHAGILGVGWEFYPQCSISHM